MSMETELAPTWTVQIEVAEDTAVMTALDCADGGKLQRRMWERGRIVTSGWRKNKLG